MTTTSNHDHDPLPKDEGALELLPLLVHIRETSQESLIPIRRIHEEASEHFGLSQGETQNALNTLLSLHWLALDGRDHKFVVVTEIGRQAAASLS